LRPFHQKRRKEKNSTAGRERGSIAIPELPPQPRQQQNRARRSARRRRSSRKLLGVAAMTVFFAAHPARFGSSPPSPAVKPGQARREGPESLPASFAGDNLAPATRSHGHGLHASLGEDFEPRTAFRPRAPPITDSRALVPPYVSNSSSNPQLRPGAPASSSLEGSRTAEQHHDRLGLQAARATHASTCASTRSSHMEPSFDQAQDGKLVGSIRQQP